ncbi:hypothetical protein FKR81_42390 [Lentzea tibetensis]|uniref:Uncharacterized protein n=1 Tax=Lentzea tibetensis TaxID=2591470 RepID=A0A563EEI2_9PSEU|nr:hypothetical protein [Lentzea tibetensis]TWP43519.1 hypothetical protein FKR81_42390 [Lentzea tibetensis]
MTQTKSIGRRIGIIAGILVGALVLGYVVWAVALTQITYASDADCATAQTVVTAGGALSDADAAKNWATDAEARKEQLSHDTLKEGLGQYIAYVEQNFAGKPDPAQKTSAATTIFDACRDIKMSFPAPR